MGCALTVPGSVNAWTEANVSQDPESADTVLRSGLPLVIVGRDVTAVTHLATDIPQRWKESGSPIGLLLGQMVAFYQRAYAVNFPALHGCFLPDPLAMAITLDESLVTNWLSRDLCIELDGPTIEEKHAIPHHHAAKPDADRNLLSRFAHHQLI